MSETPELPPDVMKGTRQVRAVVASLIGAQVLLVVLFNVPVTMALPWMVAYGFLWLTMNLGRGWPRWVMTGLAGINAIGLGYGAVQGVSVEGYGWTVYAGLAVVHAWSGFVLAMSPKITAFLAHKRAAGQRPPT